MQDGLTCLHLAVVSGSDATVRLLIAQGAEREAVTNVSCAPRYIPNNPIT